MIGRPGFAAAASEAGIPMLIDPLTFLWQGEVRDKDPWKKLSFARAAALTPADLSDPFLRDQLVAQALDFQVENGATAILPPYVYVRDPDDPWFEITLRLMAATARRMATDGIHLPIVPVMCVAHKGFTPRDSWSAGIDRFCAQASEYDPQAIAASFSPMKAKDRYAKQLKLFAAHHRLQTQTRAPILAWRQGFFGPALTAAGAAGYETGIATAEFCDVATSTRNRAPRDESKRRRGGGTGIYIDPLSRTVPPAAADALLHHDKFNAKVMCNDRRCCPNGITSTEEHRREHAVRSRARSLAALDALPHPTWRLHQIEKDALSSSTLAAQANRILENANVKMGIAAEGYADLARVAHHLRTQNEDSKAA